MLSASGVKSCKTSAITKTIDELECSYVTWLMNTARYHINRTYIPRLSSVKLSAIKMKPLKWSHVNDPGNNVNMHAVPFAGLAGARCKKTEQKFNQTLKSACYWIKPCYCFVKDYITVDKSNVLGTYSYNYHSFHTGTR
jgi:hypothetical protein